MNALYLTLREAIAAEMSDLRRIVKKVTRVFSTAPRVAADQDIYLDSVALGLHSFYVGVERIFERVATTLDGGVPTGERWHRELLTQMTHPIADIRPAVISSETAKDLTKFLAFRHLIRNIYSFDLDAKRLGELVDTLPRAFDSLKNDIEKFSEFLQEVGTN